MIEPKTHPVKPSVSSLQATREAKALWDELRDIINNEEAWFIINKHLTAAHENPFA